jgi:hypothetical protein
MIKKFGLLSVALATMISGCAINMKIPHMATDKTNADKTGTASCYVVLGIYWGDCSIATAKEAGSITEVSSIDHELTGVVYLLGRSTTIVKGK